MNFSLDFLHQISKYFEAAIRRSTLIILSCLKFHIIDFTFYLILFLLKQLFIHAAKEKITRHWNEFLRRFFFPPKKLADREFLLFLSFVLLFLHQPVCENLCDCYAISSMCAILIKILRINLIY